MDVQFKCYHVKDKQMYVNWPNQGLDVSVMINNNDVPIPVVRKQRERERDIYR